MSKNFVSYDDAQALMQAIEEGKLTVTDTMPAADPSLLDNTKLYIGPDTATLEKGGMYQCQAIEVIPEGTENPQSEGWYVYDSVSEEYELTTDTTVVSGTTYYEIKWVNISRADVDLSKYKTIFSGTVAQYEALPAAEKKEYDYIASEEEGTVGADIYSDTEIKTNKVWIDGKPIYRRICPLFTDTATVDHTINGAQAYTAQDVTINNAKLLIYGMLIGKIDNLVCDFPGYCRISTTGAVSFYSMNNMGESNNLYMIVEYTKTTD